MERVLVSVRTIGEVSPIPKADRLEVVKVDGWKVVAKKGEFKEGDLCRFFEIDSFVPHDFAPFLTPLIKSPCKKPNVVPLGFGVALASY